MIRESHKNKSVLNGSKPFYKFQNRSIYIKTVLYYLCPSCMVTTNRSHTSSKRSKSVLVIMLYTHLWLFVHLHGHIVNIYIQNYDYLRLDGDILSIYIHIYDYLCICWDILSIYIQNYEYLCLYGDIFTIYSVKKGRFGDGKPFLYGGQPQSVDGKPFLFTTWSMGNHFWSTGNLF